MAYTVKGVADLAGISVRALHHYDHVGLLRPTALSPAGYRLYGERDLERLQQVLFFRELGFSLKEIKAILDSPGFDRREALIVHRRLLLENQRRLESLIRSVDRTIEAMEGGERMDEKEMFEGFDESTMQQYRKEASERWGKEIVDESYRRIAKYSKEEWKEIVAKGKEWERTFATLMDRDPADPEVQKMVAQHHQSINIFYDCSPEMYRGLGELYVTDSRFTAHYDEVRPGLAQFMRAAMNVYCDRLEGRGA